MRVVKYTLNSYDYNSDLGLLKRDKKLQERYNTWSAEVRKEYGSMGQFHCRCTNGE